MFGSLARHSDINLTMMKYTYTSLESHQEAITGLPDISPASQGGLRTTGTDDVLADENSVAFCVPKQGRNHAITCDQSRQSDEDKLDPTKQEDPLQNKGKACVSAGKKSWSGRGESPPRNQLGRLASNVL